MTQPRIAVMLPCFNEEAAIEQTVAGFRAALPGATIYVYDNNSRDRTVELAKAAQQEGPEVAEAARGLASAQAPAMPGGLTPR